MYQPGRPADSGFPAAVMFLTGGAGREGGGPGPEGFPKAGKGEKKAADRYAPHNTLATSKLSVTVAGGANDVVVDLSKAGG